MSWWTFTPIGAVVRLFQIAKEHESNRGKTRETIIGSAPYHPPEDNGTPWEREENDQFGNQVWSRPYVNRKAQRPPSVTVPQWCGRCGQYTDHATGKCGVCGK